MLCAIHLRLGVIQQPRRQKFAIFWPPPLLPPAWAVFLYHECGQKKDIFLPPPPSYCPHTLISLINVEPTLTDFEQFHPPQKKSTLHVYWFLRFFPPSTPRLLELCISFFHKIPPSTFSHWLNFAPPPRLFQPPRLLERWEYKLSEFLIEMCS